MKRNLDNELQQCKAEVERAYDDGLLKGSEVGDATAKRHKQELNEFMSRIQAERIEWHKQLTRERECNKVLREALDKKELEQNYIIQMLLSCVERAENIIDGGPVTREAEKHVHSWRTRLDKIKKEALAKLEEALKGMEK